MNTRNLATTAILVTLLFLSSAPAQERLLIIAPDEFIDALRPLQRFKEATARRAILLSLTQVDSGFVGADQPEKIKRCIAHYEKFNGIEHVMLVGDCDKFPVRYRWWGKPGQEYWGVSELYYADLYENGTKTFDDWDDNNNGLYGEIEFEPRYINNDKIDFLSDVSVGRVPASTDEEVTRYVDKVIAYELLSTPHDEWFKRAALYTGSLGFESTQDTVGRFLANRGITIEKRYDHRNYTDPPLIFAEDLNTGFGFVSYLGHGHAWGWEWFSSADLSNNLANSNKLPVVFAGACDTGMFARMARFHPYKDVNGDILQNDGMRAINLMNHRSSSCLVTRRWSLVEPLPRP